MRIKKLELRTKIVDLGVDESQEAEAKGIGKQVTSACDVAQVARKLIGNCAQEHFVVFMLDVKNRILGVSEISIGTVNGVSVSPREIFRIAIHIGACSVIVAHNHPSEDVTPSDLDINLTDKLVIAAKTLCINFLDHVIVSEENVYSIIGERRTLEQEALENKEVNNENIQPVRR